MKDAYKNGDKSAASKLYGRAKRHRGVVLKRVDEEIAVFMAALGEIGKCGEKHLAEE